MANIVKLKSKKGISYKVQIRHNGYKPIYKTFKDESPREAYKRARAFAHDVESQMEKGTYKESADLTINSFGCEIETYGDLIRLFKTKIAPQKYAYADKYNCMYDWWIFQVGDFKIGTLFAVHLSACKQLLITEKIKKKNGETTRSNNTINKYLMCFSAVLTWAFKELEILEYNPMSKISIMKKPSGRKRTLNDKEKVVMVKICEDMGDDVYLFFLLLLMTGGRYSEVEHLEVENIDFKNSRVHFIDTKNGTNRGVGINPKLLNLIKEYIDKRNIESGYIFLNKNKTKLIYMRGKLQNAIKKAGLKDFHIHDLRHTFASKNAENGASLLDISVLLGHKSLVMSRRYTHLVQEHTDRLAREAADSFDVL